MTPVRRSSRANKGQHARLQQQKQEQEMMEEALRRAEEEAEQERIRTEEGHVLCLVCGTTDLTYDEETDDREMIQCEECKTWQHNECMLANPKKIPKRYLCSLCDPGNKHYKKLKYTMDPEETKRELAKDDLRKAKKQASVRRLLEDLQDTTTPAKLKGADDDSNSEEGESDEDSDDEEEPQSDDTKEEPLSDSEKKATVKRSHPKAEKKPSPLVKKRKTVTPPTPVHHSTPDEIEQKARQAVTKRFEGMFLNLLHDQTVEGEEGTVEEISSRWSKKLEEALYEAQHDHETGRLARDYKEVSTRIFVNVKDAKNTKLRTSIISRHIPFNKLVRMPVNELLNPDLRKEKEEAIKESMTLATLEKSKVSNIRRTHKGDIVLENEDSATATAQYDFNVGMHIDGDDDKKFIKSENNASISARKQSLYGGPLGDDHDNDDDDDGDANDTHDYDPTSAGADVAGDNDTEYDPTGRSHSQTILDDEDDDLAAILGETKKKIEQQVESYDPMAVPDGKECWKGQTIFTGVTNFSSSLHYKATTLSSAEFSSIASIIVDPIMPMEIEGRLDARKGDEYLTKVATTRKLVVLELKPQEDNDTNFKKLFDYFYSKAKFGVVPNKQKFVKDCYIVPYQTSIPRFMRDFPGLDLKSTGPSARLFLVFVIRQELIASAAEDGYDPSSIGSSTTANAQNTFDFLSALSAPELAIVNKIFDTYPRARNDPVFLIQQLQVMMSAK